MSTSTIWLRRRDDDQFRAAFEIARDQAVASLQAELVSRGLALVRAATPEQAASAALPGMDAKFLLSLVQCHRANLGKDPGEARAGRSDPKEAAARLSALLLRMRMERTLAVDEVALAVRGAEGWRIVARFGDVHVGHGMIGALRIDRLAFEGAAIVTTIRRWEAELPPDGPVPPRRWVTERHACVATDGAWTCTQG